MPSHTFATVGTNTVNLSANTKYIFNVYGAGGGGGIAINPLLGTGQTVAPVGGAGAAGTYVTSTFTTTTALQVTIVVGEGGAPGKLNGSSGGGGGNASTVISTDLSTIVIIAGGGGAGENAYGTSSGTNGTNAAIVGNAGTVAVGPNELVGGGVEAGRQTDGTGGSSYSNFEGATYAVPINSIYGAGGLATHAGANGYVYIDYEAITPVGPTVPTAGVTNPGVTTVTQTTQLLKITYKDNDVVDLTDAQKKVLADIFAKFPTSSTTDIMAITVYGENTLIATKRAYNVMQYITQTFTDVAKKFLITTLISGTKNSLTIS